MAEIQQVIKCDCCNRTVAELRSDGTLVVRQRHDGEWHETELHAVRIEAVEDVRVG